MNYKTIKRCAHVFRVLLLSFTFVALGVVGFWIFSPTQVDSFGRRVVKKYEKYHREKFNRCESLLALNGEAALGCFEECLNEVNEIKNGDRLAPCKRRAYELMAAALDEAGNYSEELSWIEKWIAFDGRDVNALVRRALVKRKIPGLKEEGTEELRTLYQMVPGTKEVSINYACSLLEEKKYFDAFYVVDDFLNRPENSVADGWQMFVDTGKSFNAAQCSNLTPDVRQEGRLNFKLRLQPGVTKIRIDPPPYMMLEISCPELVSAAASAPQLEFFDLPLGFNQVVRCGDFLQTSGENDPYFFWALPESSISTREAIWSFSVRVKKVLPADIDILFTPSVSETLENTLLKNGKAELLARFRQMRDSKAEFAQARVAASIAQGYLELFWRNAPDSFSQARKKRVLVSKTQETNSYVLDYQFSLDTAFSQLRIDLPDIPNISYRLDLLEIQNSKGEIFAFPLEAFTPASLHNVKKDGRTFRVTGPDPFFCFDPPEVAAEITSLKIRGVGK
ncbi:hypothetical protein [uncultured Desulfuromonas sp.]|uniref:hypothetical protein n=1 Tax=uncultured Desulfuromonas sp. TaxID=181013 RepID=UPI002AAC2BE2|nr:hypothetical protein [uncultured Desulfuromonas sp.]